MFLAGLISHIRVRVMICRGQNGCEMHHYMPNSLIQLLNWVTNDKTFNTGDNTPEMQTDDLRKC
jgi:hypothetical protein